MKTIEQVNEDFNVKKPKKKGLIIGGIIVAVVFIAFILVYFLVFAKPQFIFDGAIDKLLKIELNYYDSIKLDSKVKISMEFEDSNVQQQLKEIEKYTLKLGTQMDFENKQEIVDLGLEYDNDQVVDAQVYYNNGEMYTYFEGLFDKYIKLDMNEEQKEQLEAIFNTTSSKEQMKNSKKAIKIIKNELKTQIKEEGEFDKEKTTIDIGEKEKRVTKTTLTLSQKNLYNIVSNVCSNLASNENFLDCFKESPKDILEELADEIKGAEANSKNKIKISLYTKGLLNNLLALDVEIYSDDEANTITISAVKEDKNLYTYTVSSKTESTKVDVIKGKIEIEKDKGSRNQKSGKVTTTMEVAETGTIKLEMDYLAEFNKGIDKKNVSNSINITEMTEQDMQSILEKLMERPLIGNLIKNQINGNGISSIGSEDNITDGSDNDITLPKITTSQNEVKDETYGYSVTYSVPSTFKYESNYSYDYDKYYSLKDNNLGSQIDAHISLKWCTNDEYKDDINWDYDYYKKDTTYYKNVNLSEEKTIRIGDKDFKCQSLTYESNSEYYNEKYQKEYIWYNLDDENIFSIELEAADAEITENIIKGFLDITVTKSN